MRHRQAGDQCTSTRHTSVCQPKGENNTAHMLRPTAQTDPPHYPLVHPQFLFLPPSLRKPPSLSLFTSQQKEIGRYTPAVFSGWLCRRESALRIEHHLFHMRKHRCATLCAGECCISFPARARHPVLCVGGLGVRDDQAFRPRNTIRLSRRDRLREKLVRSGEKRQKYVKNRLGTCTQKQ